MKSQPKTALLSIVLALAVAGFLNFSRSSTPEPWTPKLVADASSQSERESASPPQIPHNGGQLPERFAARAPEPAGASANRESRSESRESPTRATLAALSEILPTPQAEMTAQDTAVLFSQLPPICGFGWDERGTPPASEPQSEIALTSWQIPATAPEPIAPSSDPLRQPLPPPLGSTSPVQNPSAAVAPSGLVSPYPAPISPDVGSAAHRYNPHAQASTAPLPPAQPGVDPHAEVFSQTAFPSARECAQCHQQIFDEWAISSHAYASISPMFHVFEQTINRLSQGTVGYFCLRCHAPVATTMGLRRDQPIWDGPLVFREGVTCVACHRVKTPYTKANGERRIEPGSLLEPVYGAGDGLGVETVLKYKDHFKVKTSLNEGTSSVIHQRAIQFEEIHESTFCASCHQVAVQPGIKLEVVWDQYRASPAWREGTSCQDCHMGKVPGRAEGYAVGPAAIVNEKVVGPERQHSNHVFFGPGYPITHPGLFPVNPRADRWSFNEWLLFDWKAGWGTPQFEEAVARGAIRVDFPPIWAVADDRYDAREIVAQNIARIAYKKDLRRQVLENGSHLDGPFFTSDPQLGRPLNFYFCLTNTNRGHNMPSGSLGAQPQIWMNVVLIGPSGERLWESGYLDSDGDLADIHSRDVLNRRIPFDDQLFNLQTKFLTTNVKGTDREMYLPVNIDIDQIPFLRPAPQPVTTINHPPFIRMEGHSLPATASRKAKYSVPSSLIQEPGTYRLSVRLRSRSHPVYFMRFCNATPEMMQAMNQETVDFHVHSIVFEIQ